MVRLTFQDSVIDIDKRELEVVDGKCEDEVIISDEEDRSLFMFRLGLGLMFRSREILAVPFVGDKQLNVSPTVTARRCCLWDLVLRNPLLSRSRCRQQMDLLMGI